MKVKKILLSIISMLVLISLALTSKVFAADVSVYFGIIQKGPSGWGYAIGDPTNGGSQIWNIVKYKGSNKASGYDWKDAYCARAGRGLGNMTTGVADTEVHNYVNAFNMRTEKETILNYGSDATLNGQVNRILPTANTKIAGTEVTCYDAILSVADLVYLREDANKDSYKEELMTKALEKTVNQYSDYNYKITEDDIIAVQQAVIWYFTNYDETKYNLLENASWLSYVTDTTTTYTSLNDYRPNGQGSNDEGPQRQEQAVALYKYLINTAIENAKNSNYKGINPVTLYTNIADITGTQPIIIIEKGEEKEFDLALRKYITKVDDHELTNSNETRIPNPNTTKLESGDETTAQYNHRKNPVKVKTGSKVTYNLTIYNEGEVAGRATKISDQLPTGLKLDTTGTVTSEKGNVYQISVDANNKVTLVTDGTNNINAFDGTNLDKDTVSIVCEVTQTASTQSDIILTNLAWIAEEVNASTNTVITNQKGEDRDSEPSTIDTKTADQLKTTDIGYTGKDNYSKEQLNDSTKYFKGGQDDDDFEKVILEQDTRKVDLALRKYIVSITNNSNTTILDGNNSRVPDVKEDSLLTGTTATYNHKKDPVEVEEGSLVNYKLTIYNEGNMAGRATKVVDQLPAGLEFVSVVSGNFEKDTYNETTNKLTLKRKDGNETNLPAYEEGKLVENSETIEIQCKVTAKADKENNKVLTNIAWIEDQVDEAGRQTDRDSTPGNTNVPGSLVTTDNGYTNNDSTDLNNKDHYFEGQEDDDDFEKVVLKPKAFDLKLIKRIVEVNGQEVPERIKNVDVSKLNTKDENGKLITTAIYNHTKEPVQVQKGNYVVYMLRVYNEGSMAGYAAQIKDHLPEYLEFVDGDFNKKYGWEVSEDGRTVTTKYLSDDKYLIEAAVEKNGKIELDYKDVPIMCKVKSTAKTGEKVTNIADISIYEDEKHKEIGDRDSSKDNVKLPDDKDLPSYKDDEKGDYIPGQEDDDDFEKVIIKKFDLALRKFITAVNDKEVTTRIPVPQMGEDGNIKYNHTKEPVEVTTKDIVTYTLRVYNEGEINGYASKVSDDLPEGLEFLPENSLNKEMRWVMYDKDGKETTNVKDAVKITTDYLSKEQGEERMKQDSSLKENPNLIKAFDTSKDISDTNPDYKEVKIAFKVVEPNSSKKILVNAAQISDDSDEDGNEVDDEDSIPDKWNEGEDDQDKEYVKLVEFDLALRKWVTQAIVIENGKQTVTNTGHQPYDDPEAIVKVELHRKKLKDVTVKFKYSIRVINEGDIEGYAKEVTDYIPEGLKFVASDNPGWTDKGNNVITTRLLENTLLKPGEYADVEVLLTWVNNENNMGLKTNIAEISEDYNDKGVPDRDSTPNNKKDGEDDIDDAPVMLSISTGKEKVFIILGVTVLITIAGGVVLIKKFVL